MALSRSMKNLMHDSAQARRGGGNPTSGGGRPGMDRPSTGRLPGQMAGLKTKVMQAREGAGGGMGQYNPGPKLQPRGPMPDRGPRGPVMRSPGGPPPTGGPGGIAGKIMEKYSQAKQRGGGMMRPAVPSPGKPRPGSGTFGFAAQRGAAPAIPGPAALAKPRGQAVAQRVAGRQGPPARRGGMARALGSGGSRRRMLR